MKTGFYNGLVAGCNLTTGSWILFYVDTPTPVKLLAAALILWGFISTIRNL